MNRDFKESLLQIEKPGRYTGGELNSVIKEDAQLDFALCFPDVYEVGMSYLGHAILYEVLNNMPEVYAQRAYCPWVDRMDQMRENGWPLTSLETQQPLNTFDILGFNLSYEMCYSNVLAMLDLSGLPLLAEERENHAPIVIGGGACTVNPEPLAEIFDAFIIGEGEEVLPELCKLHMQHQQDGFNKESFLQDAAQIEGVYVPSLYCVQYHADGTVQAITAQQGAPAQVKRRFLQNFEHAQTVTQPVLPYINTVHDRCVLEIMRGCPNGCRFCQAGYYTRPVRERSAKTMTKHADSIIRSTGYEEISLLSLSSGDHSEVGELIDELVETYKDDRVSVALPSMRASNFKLAEQLTQVRKTGFTFAPEAGTQRLRDVINKNISEEEILKTAEQAFLSGANRVKLYFMIGLPSETMEDLDGIADVVQKVREVYFALPKEKRGRNPIITVSVATFVPKPCTPFQWEPQDTMATIQEKQQYLQDKLKQRGVRYQYHDASTSVLEAVFARGDRRLNKVLIKAYEKGARFDAWHEHFNPSYYMQAMEEFGLDVGFYANRKRAEDEIFPYQHIDTLLSKKYLLKERDKAFAADTTAVCSEKCSACGLQNKGCTYYKKAGDVV